MYKLMLDDERNPKDIKWVEIPLGPYTIVRNYDDFVKCINKNGLPSVILMDHDLAHEHYRASMYDPDRHYNNYYGSFKEKTGLECAKYLVDYCIKNGKDIPEYVCHSMNPIGRENIINLMESAKKHIEEHKKNRL